jgi:hypothetical protein
LVGAPGAAPFFDGHAYSGSPSLIGSAVDLLEVGSLLQRLDALLERVEPMGRQRCTHHLIWVFGLEQPGYFSRSMRLADLNTGCRRATLNLF